MAIQQDFAAKLVGRAQEDDSIIAVAAGGSWITNELDEFSDLDLVIVTKQKIGGDRAAMIAFAEQQGSLLSAFTGEHVGELRLLICLYDAPLLHVDYKFITLEEVSHRVENPVVLLDKEGLLEAMLSSTSFHFPHPEYQWIEDRFWTWIHYALTKLGRGELLEALDFLSFLRMQVLGPLMQVKNGELPRGVRKIEITLSPADQKILVDTVPGYTSQSIFEAIKNAVKLYRELRNLLFDDSLQYNHKAETAVLNFLANFRRT